MRLLLAICVMVLLLMPLSGAQAQALLPEEEAEGGMEYIDPGSGEMSEEVAAIFGGYDFWEDTLEKFAQEYAGDLGQDMAGSLFAGDAGVGIDLRGDIIDGMRQNLQLSTQYTRFGQEEENALQISTEGLSLTPDPEEEELWKLFSGTGLEVEGLSATLSTPADDNLNLSAGMGLYRGFVREGGSDAEAGFALEDEGESLYSSGLREGELRWGIGYNLGAGVQVPLRGSASFTADASYRYIQMDIDWDDEVYGEEGNFEPEDISREDYDGFEVSAGISITF